MKKSVENVAKNDVESETRSGTKHGPRNRYFFLAAIKDKNIVYEAVRADSPEEAEALFKEHHNLKPQICDAGIGITGGGNGYYLAKGTGQSDIQRISVTVSAEQLARRTSQAVRGEFRGWKVYGSGLKSCQVSMGSEIVNFGDNELFSIEFSERVDPNNKKLQKPKLKKKEVIRASDLENVQVL